MSEELIQSTKSLLDYNRLFLQYFQEGREEETTYDFYKVVKPFVDKVKVNTERWSELSRDWLIKNPQKHIHLQQIKTTNDHIEQLSVQAFFPKTSKARFLNTNRTVEFFLLEMLRELDN